MLTSSPQSDSYPAVTFSYRPDIQGLRAICVTSVMLYHAYTPALPGGFIGVDVFFVLSGYLITSLMLSEGQNLSILRFWARRARRLLPNAILVLLATFAAGAGMSAFPMALATDVLAALGYVANYAFAMRATDYFAAEHTTPLLHFWSLSVEEQYYFAFPLVFLACIKRSRRTLLIALLAIAIASFALSLVYLTRNQPASFFNTEARIWQIACGGILASVNRHNLPQTLRAFIGWSGVVGLTVTFFVVSDRSYPGFPAILPVLSALACLAGGDAKYGPSIVLQNAVMQRVGDASYSLYLWHFPPMVLAEQLFPEAPFARAASLLVSVPLAFLAYAWVERPMRHVSGLSARRVIAIAMTTQIVAAMAVVSTALLLQRISSGEQRWAAAAAHDKSDFGTCQLGAVPLEQTCRFGTIGGSKRVVLFGDSYGAHLFEGLNRAAAETGWELTVRVRSSCPIVDAFAYNPELKIVDTECMQWRSAVLAEIESTQPHLIIVATRAGAARQMYAEAGVTRLSWDRSHEVWQNGFAQMLARLGTHARVAVVAPVPHPRPDLFSCLARRPADQCVRPRAEALREEQPALDVLAKLPSIQTVDLAARICSANTCRVAVDGVPVYSDNSGHLTRSFSAKLQPVFAEILKW